MSAWYWSGVRGMHFSSSGLSWKYRSDCFVVTSGYRKLAWHCMCLRSCSCCSLCRSCRSVQFLKSIRHIICTHGMHVRWRACDVLATIISGIHVKSHHAHLLFYFVVAHLTYDCFVHTTMAKITLNAAMGQCFQQPGRCVWSSLHQKCRFMSLMPLLPIIEDMCTIIMLFQDQMRR